VVTANVCQPRSRRRYLYAGTAVVVLAGAGVAGAVLLGSHSNGPSGTTAPPTGSTGATFAPVALLDELTSDGGALPSSEVPTGMIGTQFVSHDPSVSTPRSLVDNEVVTDSFVDQSLDAGNMLYFVFETDTAATTLFADGSLVPAGTAAVAEGVTFPASTFATDRIHCGTYQSDDSEQVRSACWALDGNVVLRGETFGTTATDVSFAVG
jgi:hypothetical protein